FFHSCRVFQRDLKNNTAENESTGMNTLLHAPIQALVQQTEWRDADAIQRTSRHDTTLIFSDENEMDMTASHTAVITRNLKNNQADKTEKIDITSFLPGLNSNNEKGGMSKEFHFFSDPANQTCPSFEQKEDATTVKKIDLKEFLISLKSAQKALNPIEGPEKENVFFVPSQVSEDMPQSPVKSVYSHEPPDTCNVSKVFREQDDGMDMTKCQACDVNALFPGCISSETVFRGDKTVVFAKCDNMEITGNYTAVVYNDSTKEMNNCQNSDRLEKTLTLKVVNKALSTGEDSEREFSIGKTVSSEEDFQNPRSGHGLHLRAAEVPFLASIPEPPKASSQLPSLLEKSVVIPSGENMDLTGNYAVMVPDHNINAGLSERKAVPGYLVADENKIMSLKKGVTVTINTVPADKIVFTHNHSDMEITASHTIAVDNNIDGFENQE
ncbi:Protein CASC5, partial [Mesitornis unicolor]